MGAQYLYTCTLHTLVQVNSIFISHKHSAVILLTNEFRFYVLHSRAALEISNANRCQSCYNEVDYGAYPLENKQTWPRYRP